MLDHEQAPVSGEAAAPLSDAVDALSRAGATVVEGWPADVDPARSYESFGFHVRAFFAFQEPGEDSLTFAEFVDHENRRMAARAAWDRYFKDTADVFLCPVNFTPAFPHDERPFGERTVATPEGERPYDAQAFWVSHASLPGLPVVAAPVERTRGGLPVGAQVISPLYEDDTAITFAELFADVTGGYRDPGDARRIEDRAPAHRGRGHGVRIDRGPPPRLRRRRWFRGRRHRPRHDHTALCTHTHTGDEGPTKA